MFKLGHLCVYVYIVILYIVYYVSILYYSNIVLLYVLFIYTCKSYIFGETMVNVGLVSLMEICEIAGSALSMHFVNAVLMKK